MNNFFDFLKEHIIPVILTGLFVIIAAIIGYFAVKSGVMDLDISVYDKNNNLLEGVKLEIKGIENLTETTDKSGKVKLINLKRGSYEIVASKDNYKDSIVKTDYHKDKITIIMDVTSDWEPFSLSGWNIWNNYPENGDIDIKNLSDNTLSITGNGKESGYNSTTIDTNLSRKILKLEITNSNRCILSGNRLFKMTYNNNDKILTPINIKSLVKGEYISGGDKTVEFRIAENFDGKLQFVFYGAVFKDLRITAFYQ